VFDRWIRINSKKKYDDKGKIAKTGKINKKILNKAINNFTTYHNKYVHKNGFEPSYDIKDFEDSFNILYPRFLKDLSLKDGAATLTEFTVRILDEMLQIVREGVSLSHVFILCGCGRKNDFLVEKIREKEISRIKLIDEYGIDGDFVESQAFAYLAIRSYLNLPISFPTTTGVDKPCSGGIINRI
jgi:anhydro-N-acetylmuramic acid kinase